MADIKLPGIGPVDKKYVYIGVALIGGIAAYAYWNASRVSNAAPTDSDYTTTEDQAAEDYAYDGGVGEYTGATGSQPPVNVDTDPAPSNNAEWATQAISRLGDLGYDGITISTAIGKYLARQPLTATQADIVRQATALLGNPPTGEYPILIDSGSPPTTPNGPPPVTMAAPTGLTTWGNGPTRLTVPLKWNAVPGADYYRVYRKGVAYNIGSSEDTQLQLGGLSPNTSYTFTVRAVGEDGKYGPASASKTVKTKP